MPAKAPMFCTIIFTPIQNVFFPAISPVATPCSRSERSITSPTSSGLKKPMPQSPITPETHSIIPNSAGVRHRASPNSDAYEPKATPVRRPSARACTHFSGSFKRICKNTHMNAGSAPMRNMYFHADPAANAVPSKLPSHMLTTPAVTLPTAESAWSVPSALLRAASGRLSATSATASPKTPPTPRPVMKRYVAKSIHPFEKAESPVQTE